MTAISGKIRASVELSGPILDVEQMCIRRDGQSFELSKKALAILRLLRNNSGRFIGLNELLDTVWPDTYIQPEIVKTYIKQIRYALNDDAHAPRFIETRRGCGYRFVGDLPLAGSSERPASGFVGRKHEIARLEAAIEVGHDGARRFVFVTGEAGVGKSALLSEIEERMHGRDDLLVVRGNCNPEVGDNAPFYPVLEAFHAIARQIDRASLKESVARLAPSWLPALSLASSADATYAPHRHGDIGEMCALLEALAQERTLVVLIEDLQWADRQTLGLFATLARRRMPASLVFFGSHRLVDITSIDHARVLITDLKIHCGAEEIVLLGFTQQELADYLGRHLTDAADIQLATYVSTRSDCNPFLVQTIVSDIRNGSRWPGAGNDNVPVELPVYLDLMRAPHPAEDMLELQLVQFGSAARRILEAASVSGRFFCSWSVAQLLDCEMAVVEDVCARLADAGYMLRHAGHYELPNGTLSPRFAFKHEIYFTCLLRRHPMALLANMHRKFARRVEDLWGGEVRLVAADITNRYEYAGDWSRAIDYAKIAVHEARVRSDVPSAQRMAQKVLKLAAYLPADQRSREVEFIRHEYGLN